MVVILQAPVRLLVLLTVPTVQLDFTDEDQEWNKCVVVLPVVDAVDDESVFVIFLLVV